MTRRTKFPGPRKSRPITATALICELCLGPRTPLELAAALHCRPSCLAEVLSNLRRLKLVKPAWELEGSPPAARDYRVALAIDPAAAWAVTRLSVSSREKKVQKGLHGSLLFLHNENARQNGAAAVSNSAPCGEPGSSHPGGGT